MTRLEARRARGPYIVFYPREKQQLGSLNAVIFFDYIFAWLEQAKDVRGVWKTAEQIEDECGLTYEEQKTARKHLRDRGVLVETLDRLNHRMFYHIDAEAYESLFSRSPETPDPGDGKPATGLTGKPRPSIPTSTATPTANATKDLPRGKREAHPLFSHVKDLVFRYYRNHNHVDPEWNGREAKALSDLLAANPAAPREHWNACMVGRSRSDVNHADRPGMWMASLSSYRNALNAYKQPKENPDGTPKSYGPQTREEKLLQAAQDAIRSCREVADDAGDGPAGFDDGGFPQNLFERPGRFPAGGHSGGSGEAEPAGAGRGKILDAQLGRDGHRLPGGSTASLGSDRAREGTA